MTKHFTARALIVLAVAAAPLTLVAQDKPEAAANEHHSSPAWDTRILDCSKQPSRAQLSDCTTARAQTRVIPLRNVSNQNEANEILVAVRNNFDPGTKVYLITSENLISITTYPEEFERVQNFIRTVDLPQKAFRFTFTITDFDGDKRVGTQHFSMVGIDGQRATLKQGDKIPVATGSNAGGKSSNGIETEFTYLDVGMNIDVTPTTYASGVHLLAKIEQSSVAPEPSVIAGVSEPIIRQSVLTGIIDVPSGKPVILGSVDLTGTTHHLDIAVAVEPIP